MCAFGKDARVCKLAGVYCETSFKIVDDIYHVIMVRRRPR